MIKLNTYVRLKDDGTTCNEGVRIPHIETSEVGKVVKLVGIGKAFVRFPTHTEIADLSWLRPATSEEIAEASLFAGVYPAGIVYADRRKEQHGDYKRVAFISYATLKLDLEKDCPADLVEMIRTAHAKIEKRRGQPFQISACGQSVILGAS